MGIRAKKTNVRIKKSILVAMQYSYDGGIVWEGVVIRIEVKGQPAIIDVNDGINTKPNTLVRLATLTVPVYGIKAGNIQLFDNDDVRRLKADPGLLHTFIETLPWSEPFYLDDLDWSDWIYPSVS